MPKRKYDDEDSDEYIRRQMKKLEKKLRKRSKKRLRISSSSEDDQASPVPSSPEDGQDLLTTDSLLCNDQPGLPTEDVDLEIVEPKTLGSSTSAPAEPEECALDDEIMKMLGEFPTKNKKIGINIQKDIALRWEHITTSGLSRESRKQLLENHLIPGNCSKLTAPLLNPEIKAAMSEMTISKDKATEQKQNQVASAISCIGEALTKIFNSENKDATVIKSLLEGAQLLCDLQYYESMNRRRQICCSLKKEIKSQLYETEVDTFLFGENLSETLKAAKAISKSGSEIKLSKPKTNAARSTRNLNSKPQLATSRQPTKRRPEPAAYSQTSTAFPYPALPQRRQYPYPVLPAPPPPPPPPPPAPPVLPPAQQRPRQQRPYQRR